MCILCDLKSEDKKEYDNAIYHVDRIIKSCEEVASNYRMIKRGSIKPHTKQMKQAVRDEAYLIKMIILDVL